MSGAYVAKPVVIPPVVDPPGWNPIWPHPGPNPPGYVSNYTLLIDFGVIIALGDVNAYPTTLRDYGTFNTLQPSVGSLIDISATIDGNVIPLRIGELGSYSNSVSSIYSSIGSYWGSNPNIDFQLTAAHEGKSLVISAVSSVFGVPVSGTKTVTVTTDYSLDLVSDSSMSIGDILNVVATLSNDDQLPTNAPFVTDKVTWSAKVDEVTVQLRFDGDDTYFDSLQSSYSNVGGFWLSDVDLDFDLSEDQNDKTLVISAVGQYRGLTFTGEYDVSIQSSDWYISVTSHRLDFTYSVLNAQTGVSIGQDSDAKSGSTLAIASHYSGSDHLQRVYTTRGGFNGASVGLTRTPSSSGFYALPIPPNPDPDINFLVNFSTWIPSNTTLIIYSGDVDLQVGNYSAYYHPGDRHILTLEVHTGSPSGTIIHSYTKTCTGDDTSPWISISTSKVITVINP